MSKRNKRLEKSIESLKNQIEIHLEKLEKDVKENNEILIGYHMKELEKSFLKDLEYRMKLLGKVDHNLIEKYRERISNLDKKLSD